MNKAAPICILLVLFLFPSLSIATVIKSDTFWSGEVSLEKDVLVPEGVTLTISPGTIIRIEPSESTKTDPEYISPLTEITVRGRLVAEGKVGSPVTFLISGEKKMGWAGIIVDGGKAIFSHCVIRDAETGVDVIKGSVSMSDSLLTGNRYGLTVEGPDAVVRLDTTRVKENDYGAMLLRGATINGRDFVVKGNRKKDTYSPSMKEYPGRVKDYKAEKKEESRVYGDEAFPEETVWQGRVLVNGIVRVPENSKLIIMPGTIVEFSRKDTDNDGIGENGLFVQGILIAKGTKEGPILFRSAEKQRRMGDWDSINIMNSDKAQNLIEYCQIEDAYRGLHFHFSNVAVTETVLKNNYRGMQFQESVVTVRGSDFYGNKSGLQARDSDILFRDNVVFRNYSGMNVFRNNLTMKGNVIMNNGRDGLRVREGLPVVEGNLIDGNRYGLMVVDALYGSFNGNVISHNLEAGVSLKNADNIEVSGNAVQENGIYGIHAQDSDGLIRGNLISDNLERGIGILSFQGIITRNNIIGNGLYNLGIEGDKDVSAPLNWWGKMDVRKTISDKDADPSKGSALIMPLHNGPVAVAWPVKTVMTDTKWHGDIIVDGKVAVVPGINLVISPYAKVLFGKAGGLSVQGRITAKGEQIAPITFASLTGKNAGEWDEILIDHAVGSEFSYCIFSNATWALHSHFTDLKVDNCAFMKNNGGIRFTSGPIEVRRSYFSGNDIGIRAFRGTALISGNVFTENGTAIFVREKGGGLTIRGNNIFANDGYSIRMGDFNTEDVDARDNWWGKDVSPAETVYDAGKEPGIGRVISEPHADKQFEIGNPGGMKAERGPADR